MNTNRTINIFFSLNLFCIASYNYGMQNEITYSYENPHGELIWKEINKAKSTLEENCQLDPLSESYKQLHKKIDTKLKNNLETLINNGANPNSKLTAYNIPEDQLFENELCPLTQTIGMDFIDSTALLLEKKGDVGYVSSNNGNLLYWAKSADMITLLIQSGVDPEFSLDEGPVNFFSSFVCSSSSLEEVQRIYETFIPSIKNTDKLGKKKASQPTIFHSIAYTAITLANFPHMTPGVTEKSLYKKTAYLMSFEAQYSYRCDIYNFTPQEIIHTTSLKKLKALFNDPKVQKAAIKKIKKNQENIFIQLQKRQYGLLKRNKIKLH